MARSVMGRMYRVGRRVIAFASASYTCGNIGGKRQVTTDEGEDGGDMAVSIYSEVPAHPEPI